MQKKPLARSSFFQALKHRRWLTYLIPTLLLGPAALWACSVPVFRYALERWPADPYGVIVFHEGPLGEDQQQIAKDLSLEGKVGETMANLMYFAVDVKDESKKEVQKLWQEQKKKGAKLPWMLVKYPPLADIKAAAWSGPLNRENVDQLIDSPLRREIARRLLKGETGVWLFLESGNAEKDEAAFKLLTAELKRMKEVLNLPEIDPQDIAQGLVSVDSEQLKLQFSLLRLSRDNPQEAVLREILLDTEDDLRNFDEPMVFPMFGRGRILYALIGKGINAETIEMTARELIGPCTCQIKEQNPGIDMLMAVDWDRLVQPQVELDRELPPLPGFGGMAAQEESADSSKTEAAPMEKPTDAKKDDSQPAAVKPAAATQTIEAKTTEEPATDAKATEPAAKPAKATTTPAADPAVPSGLSKILQNVIIAGGVIFVGILLGSFLMTSRKRQV